jgi:hypothetical protein
MGGEEAEDGGGPSRECWRLFGLAIKSSYFEGVENEMVIRHDTLALQVKIQLLYHRCWLISPYTCLAPIFY